MNYEYEVKIGEPATIPLGVDDNNVSLRTAEIPVKVPQIAKTAEILKGDNDGNAVAAEAGVDYQTPLEANVDYQTPLEAGTDYWQPPVIVTLSNDQGETYTSSLSDAEIFAAAVSGRFVYVTLQQRGHGIILPLTAIAYSPDPLDNMGVWFSTSILGPSMGKMYTVHIIETIAYFTEQELQNNILVNGILLGNDGSISAAIAGYDYQTPLTAGVDYQQPLPVQTGKARQMLSTDGTDLLWSNFRIPFGKLDSTSTATVMTAQIPGITAYEDGLAFYLMNDVITSASGFTLNINGLGAMPVYQTLAAASRSTTVFNINYTMLFIYNSKRVEGGCFDIFYGYDSNTNTIGYQLRTQNQSMPMKSITYRYRILFTSADHKHFVPATNSTSTNATAARAVCQDPIDPFGAMYYYGTTTSVAAGSRPSTSYLWQQYSFSLGYSFNNGSALTLTSWEPVYIVATPQSDGSAIIDSTTPYTQTLPTTEDGKIYIYLGVAYSATQVEMLINHPVYWYKNGRLRPYTDA